MTCIKCQHQNPAKFGTYGKQKIQRYRCKACGATFAQPRHKPLGAHYTSVDTAASVVALLMEGMSIRAASRLLNVHKNTILRLLLTVGGNCRRLLGERLHNLHPKHVQADELWTYVGKKQKRLKPGDAKEKGDAYLWIALDSDSKLVIASYVGKRDERGAGALVGQLRARCGDEPFQITTDGLEHYSAHVLANFGFNIDYAQLVKVYSQPVTTGPDWFRPAHVVAVRPTPVIGLPDPKRISTSHVERFNLTVRMHLRRFARLTNAFSKSLIHLRAAVAILLAFYNFCKVHQTLRVTPAMQAGLTDHVWSITELLTS